MLDRFVALLAGEAERQNLIARSTFDRIWQRHIVDSLQLLDHAPAGSWADVGSGAGFPGLVVAIASRRPVTLIEPRTKRAGFLRDVTATLALEDRVRVCTATAQAMPAASPHAVISARAVAPLPELFAAAHRLADAATTWLLPKGRSAAEELAAARLTWQGDFALVPSITDPRASIVVARAVRPRNRR